jgi:hypothetical protein
MIKITTPYGPLDLPTGFSLQLEINSNLFDISSLIGGFTYPFTFPSSAQNRTIFSFSHLPEAEVSVGASIEATLEADGLLIEGKITINEASRNQFKGTFFTDIATLRETFSSLTIDQLEIKKFNQVIPRPYLTLVGFYTGKFGTDTYARIKIARTDGTTNQEEYLFHVWLQNLTSDTEAFQALIDRINAPANVPQAWQDSIDYPARSIVKDSMGRYCYSQFAAPSGNEPLAPDWDNSRSYPANFYVYLPSSGTYAKSLVSVPIGIAISASPYWLPVSDEPWFVFAADDTAFLDAWYEGYRPGFENYSDPRYDNSVLASINAANVIKIEDLNLGLPHRLDIYRTGGGVVTDATGGDFWTLGVQRVEDYEFLNSYNNVVVSIVNQANSDFLADGKVFFPTFCNPGFAEDSDWATVLNYYYPSVGIITSTGRSNSIIDGNSNAWNILQSSFHLVPVCGVNAILASLFEKLGLRLISNSLLTSDLPNLSVYSNRPIDRRALGILPGAEQYGAFDICQIYFKVGNYLPPISAIDFINGVRGFLFVGVFFDFRTREVEILDLKDILFSTEVEDWTGKVDLSSATVYEVQADGFILKYSHDSADNVISENVKPIFGDRLLISPPVASILDLPKTYTGEELRYVVSESSYYKADLNYLTGRALWSVYSRELNDTQIGNGAKEYQPKCSTLLTWKGWDRAMAPVQNPIAYDFTGATTYEVGTWLLITEAEATTHGVGAGLYKKKLDGVYALSNPLAWGYVQYEPIAHPDQIKHYAYVDQGRDSITFGGDTKATLRLACIDTDAKTLLPYSPSTGKTLRWDGPDGLYSERGTEWLSMLQRAREIELPVYLDAIDLSRLKLSRRVRIGGSEYLIKTIKLALPLKGKGTIVRLVRTT